MYKLPEYYICLTISQKGSGRSAEKTTIDYDRPGALSFTKKANPN
jgi:hypothetical protein